MVDERIVGRRGQAGGGDEQGEPNLPPPGGETPLTLPRHTWLGAILHGLGMFTFLVLVGLMMAVTGNRWAPLFIFWPLAGFSLLYCLVTEALWPGRW